MHIKFYEKKSSFIGDIV